MCHCWFGKGKGELTSVFEFQMEKNLIYGDILVESNLSLILIKDNRGGRNTFVEARTRG